jgi:hypothetical protein
MPQWKKDKFMVPRVKKDILGMEMVHHQDITVELSARFLTAQWEIQPLLIQLWNLDATIRGYQRMVDGQASDIYTSDMDTWSATCIV